MKLLIWALLLVFVLIIQATLLPLIAVYGVKPDLLLIIVVSSALLMGKEQGVGTGFFAGLLQDLAFGNIFGLNVLSKMATGYIAGFMERRVFKENVLLPLMAVILATAINGILMLIILLILGHNLYFPAALVNIIFLIVYNAVFAIPIHRVVCRISRIG